MSATSSRRLILLLDGTWNDSEFGPSDTNIVRLRTLISDCTGATAALPEDRPLPKESAEMVKATVSNGRENLVFYERGVGTGTLIDRLSGGAVGFGLDRNIRRAYKSLSFHYQPGDQIFIFGFSRGSYTARSLVGYIAAAGLLRRDLCNEDHERRAWDFYRTHPNDRLSGIWSDLTELVHDRDQLRVACLAVFDTVGSLGVPLEAFMRVNREHFEFHSVELPSITHVNLHALAIDEHRWPFQASLWRQPQFKSVQTRTEQVWFPGAHADVGGGYTEEAKRKGGSYIEDIPLDWMIRRLKHYFSDFPLPDFYIPSPSPHSSMEQHYRGWLHATQHDSRVGIYRLYPQAWRSIGNAEIPGARLIANEMVVSYDRHAKPLNEFVHVSALERYARSVPVGDRPTQYVPKNLETVYAAIETTYSASGYSALGNQSGVQIVGWDGARWNPEDEDYRALANDVLSRASSAGRRRVEPRNLEFLLKTSPYPRAAAAAPP